jgi:uncharacterized repeat protein (TIGR03803 family)
MKSYLQNSLLLALVPLALSSFNVAATTGSFTKAGALNSARRSHTSTLLPNGRVLAAGGIGGNNATLASSELFDPASGSWTNNSPMMYARSMASATSLSNGRVLVVGGFSFMDEFALASAESFDPVAGAWESTGPMSTPRGRHAATLLPSGKVLVAGGDDFSLSPIAFASAELYDPISGTWAPTGTMNSRRSRFSSILLPNGKVLVAGGVQDAIHAIADVELYDPESEVWTPGSSMSTARASYAATLLANGKVLVTGGFGADFQAMADAELYDPATGIWANTGSMIVRRFDHAAALLPDGRVLVTGGQDETGIPICNSEIYDPVTETWSVTGALNEGRTGFTATVLPDGRVVTVGGEGVGGTLSSTELYDSKARTWTATGSLSDARASATSSLLPDGRVLVTGGEDLGFEVLSTSEVYDPETAAWSLTGPMNDPRRKHTATLLPYGKVIVAGGVSTDQVLAGAELYDPASGQWTRTGSLTNGRFDHRATLLGGGEVLVAGGTMGFDTNGLAVVTASAELFDPDTGIWAPTGMMATNRFRFTMTLLADGKVLAAGGANSNGPLACVEVYDPNTGQWTPANPMRVPRVGHTATLLPNGKVLVAGGLASQAEPATNTLSSAELYDPDTSTWTPTSAMIEPRADHTATLLPSGNVLVAGGGLQTVSTFTTTAELYDPATETWTATTPVIIGQESQTATLLRTGKVLIAGGSNRADADGTIAELYDLSGTTAPETMISNLVSFGSSNGLHPHGGLLLGPDGNFYGTTRDGGDNNAGTIFRFTADGELTSLFSFNFTNGSAPQAGLTLGKDGNFYGTTSLGGPFDFGTIFRFSPNGTLTTLASFDGINGANPQCQLVMDDSGNFYGTAPEQGPNGFGTVFRVSADGVLTTLVSFNETNGASPEDGLTVGSDGSFYGTTANGGSSDMGTVFQVTPDGLLTTLFSFSNTNGTSPLGGVVQGSDGNLYGTTGFGGTNSGFGTIFKLATNGILTTLFDFKLADGEIPSAKLVFGNDGNLYGTTTIGGFTGNNPGAAGYGTVFRITTNGIFTPLILFDGTNGSNPQGPLALGKDGNLYGTTAHGGTSGGGTIFRVLSAVTVTTNLPPVVAITDPTDGTTVIGPITIIIQASASDTDGSVTNVQFFDGASPLGNVTSSPYSLSANLGVGSHILTAIATDNLGASTTSSPVTVTLIANSPPSVTIANPVDGSTLVGPTIVTIQAVASDSDGSVANVQFFDGVSPLGRVTSSPYSLSVNLGVGPHTLTAVASDNLGGATTSSPVSVFVTANVPPTVSITTPTNGASFITPVEITIQAGASDSDGSVTNVQFFDGDTSLGNVSASPYNLSVSLAFGVHSLVAVASDNLGATTSSSVIVTVTTNSPPPVTAIIISSATRLSDGAFQISFTNTPGASFSVLSATNPAVPSSDWVQIGNAVEFAPGQFQFTDLAPNDPQRFYRVRSP